MAETAAKIRIGCLHHSFYEVAARVVGAKLAQAHHEVTIQRGAHADLYPMLARGDIDLMVASWLPHLHAAFYGPVKDRLTPVVSLFEPAQAFWAVPGYVPASAVAAVADLAKPGIAARMHADVLSPALAIAVTQRSGDVFEDYSLEGAGYRFRAIESDEAWCDEIKALYERGAWFVTPLWQPHFLNKLLELRPLDEPGGLMGAPDTAWLMANAAFFERLPPATVAALEGLEIGLSAVTDMDVMVNVEGCDTAEAARRWLESRP